MTYVLTPGLVTFTTGFWPEVLQVHVLPPPQLQVLVVVVVVPVVVPVVPAEVPVVVAVGLTTPGVTVVATVVTPAAQGHPTDPEAV